MLVTSHMFAKCEKCKHRISVMLYNIIVLKRYSNMHVYVTSQNSDFINP